MVTMIPNKMSIHAYEVTKKSFIKENKNAL